MLVHDAQIAWKRKRIWIPTHLWSGTPPTQTLAVAGSGFYGLKLTAAAGTATEGVMRVPMDADPTKPLGFRLAFVGNTAASTVTSYSWIMLMSRLDPGSAIGGATTGALSTPWTLAQAAPASGSRDTIQWTSRGIKNEGWATKAQLFAGCWFKFNVQLSAVGGTIDASNFVTALGLEVDYCPMKTRYPGMANDAPLDNIVYT